MQLPRRGYLSFLNRNGHGTPESRWSLSPAPPVASRLFGSYFRDLRVTGRIVTDELPLNLPEAIQTHPSHSGTKRLTAIGQTAPIQFPASSLRVASSSRRNIRSTFTMLSKSVAVSAGTPREE